MEGGGGRDEDGTSIEEGLHVLQAYGCCLEDQLTYEWRHDFAQAYRIHGHKPAYTERELDSFAGQNRISSYRMIEPTVEAIKAELHLGRPVGIGLAVFDLAWYTAAARRAGEIALPLTVTSGPITTLLDDCLGGHAVVLVGYRDNDLEQQGNPAHRPGGGHFVFLNSWGEEWAGYNGRTAGYGRIPYEYVRQFCVEAAVIDGLGHPVSR